VGDKMINQTEDVPLEIMIGSTADKSHYVKYIYLKDLADVPSVKERLKTQTGQEYDLPSTAQHARMMINQEHDKKSQAKHPFLRSSYTNVGVAYNKGSGNIILIKESAFDSDFINAFISAHNKGVNYFMPPKDCGKDSQEIVDKVESMARNNPRMLVMPGLKEGVKEIHYSNFKDDPVTRFLFDDTNLGIDSKEFGRYIRKSYGIRNVLLCLDSPEIMRSQEEPYLNILRMGGPNNMFQINGNISCRDRPTFLVNFTSLK
jgi:hypothetical protein